MGQIKTGGKDVYTHNGGIQMKRFTVLLLVLVMAVAFVLPFAANAQGPGKTVRVGWYESPFNTTDQFGRRSGYAYDYQQKIAAYCGSDEAVDEFVKLMQKLMK